MLYVEMSAKAARKVEDFLELHLQTHVPLPDVPAFREVINALHAFSHDTSVIVDSDWVGITGDRLYDKP